MNAGTDEAASARVREDLASALALEAGAGTGKTTRLVERIVALLASGVPLTRLVVVTFLRAAAEEMRVRLRQELEPERAEWAVRALADLPGATIGTIHAFAQRLLAQEALAAGWDSASRVLEEAEAEELGRRHFRRWLEQAVAADPGPLVDLRRLGARAGADDLFEMARRLPLDARLAPASPPPGEAAVTALADALGEALATFDALRSACADPADLALGAGPVLGDALRELHTWTGDDRPFAACALALPSAAKGDKAHWRPPEALRDLKLALASAVGAQRELRSTLGAHVASRLLAWLAPYPAYAAERRRETAVATFDDLLRRSVALLESDRDALGRARARYDAILVDEFQDTDPVQARLLELVGGPPADAGPGGIARRFVVGDPKQAIYRFRGADIDTYLAVTSRFPAPGRLPLVENHRSVAPLLELANRVVEPLMANHSVTYRALAGGRGDLAADAPAPLQILRAEAAADAEPGSSAGQARAREADLVARALRVALSAPWRVAGRSLAPGDIALLFASRTAYPEYMGALARQGLPYRAERERNLWQLRVPRDLARIALALAHPRDPLAVTSALRTSLLGVSDQELWQHVRAGGELRLLVPSPHGTGPAIARALAALSAAAVPSDRPPSARLLDLIESLDLGAAAALEEGQEGVDQLARALESVRLFEGARAGGEGLGRVATALREVGYERGTGGLPVPAPAADAIPAEGEIRLMTVHEAKGNEFPLIVLCDPWGEPPARAERVIVRAADGRVDLRLPAPASWGRGGHFGTPGVEERHAEEQAAAVAEQVRLLYVALTRARDAVLLADVPPPKSRTGGRSLGRLLSRAAGLDAGARPLEALRALGLAPALVLPPDVAPPASAPLAAAELAAPPADLLDLRRRLAERSARVAIVRPSGLERAPLSAAWGALPEGPPEEPPDDRAEGAPARAARADVARRIGIAVHGVLADALGATSSKGAAGDWRAQVSPLTRAAGLADEAAAEVMALAGRALAHPLLARALASPRRVTEPAVSARLEGGGLVIGRCDLVFADAAGAVIVDFKTDRVAADDGAMARLVALRGYDRQLRLYARAVAGASALVVVEAYVLFARTGAAIAVALDADAAAESQSRV